MKLSRRAQRNAAMVADHGPAKRATYCRHWQLTALTCELCVNCGDPEHCQYYEEAQEYHERRLSLEGRLLKV